MSTAIPAVSPSLDRFFETVHGFHRTAAIKAAVDLDLFSAIGGGSADAAAIAARSGSSERGVRILCDFLTVEGFLHKQNARYSLAPDAAMFLDRQSPAYVGQSLEFLLTRSQMEGFEDLTGAVKRGGTTLADEGVITDEHPSWVKFARGMAPIMHFPAELLAATLAPEGSGPLHIVDIAAGHGLYGIAVARRHSQSRVTAVDWPSVLTVAQQNADAAGLTGRFRTAPGNALTVEWGGDYDLALLTNILHHFDLATCEQLLARVYASLNPGGRVAILEFIPEPDRVSPPIAAQFALMMLATTPHGDAYTYAQYDCILKRVGFARTALHDLPPTYFRAVVGSR